MKDIGQGKILTTQMQSTQKILMMGSQKTRYYAFVLGILHHRRLKGIV